MRGLIPKVMWEMQQLSPPSWTLGARDWREFKIGGQRATSERDEACGERRTRVQGGAGKGPKAMGTSPHLGSE
jgi:hypothetical protein